MHYLHGMGADAGSIYRYTGIPVYRYLRERGAWPLRGERGAAHPKGMLRTPKGVLPLRGRGGKGCYAPLSGGRFCPRGGVRVRALKTPPQAVDLLLMVWRPSRSPREACVN